MGFNSKQFLDLRREELWDEVKPLAIMVTLW